MRGNRILIGGALALASAFAAPAVLAQDVAAAGRAFEAGQAAQFRGDHGAAGGFFELADRLAPSPAALRSAIRNHAAGGNRARAATLATDALRRYPADATVRQVADDALRVVDQLATLVIRCDAPCTIVVDEAAIETVAATTRTLFVEPGAHTLTATFAGGGRAEGQHDVAVGERVEVDLAESDAGGEAGAVVAAAPAPEPEPEPESEPEVEAADQEAGGLPLWVPLAGLGATALVGGLAIWSGLDTLSARDAYESAPTKAGYDDGLGRQTRTNVLIGITIGLAATTAVLFALADMGGEEEEVSVSASLGAEGGAVMVSGAF